MERDRKTNRDDIQRLYERALTDEGARLELYGIMKHMLKAFVNKTNHTHLKNAYRKDLYQDLYLELIGLFERYNPEKSYFVSFMYSVFLSLGNKLNIYANECSNHRQKSAPNKIYITPKIIDEIMDEITESDEIDYMSQEKISLKLEQELKKRLNEKEFFVFVRRQGICGYERKQTVLVLDDYIVEFGKKVTTAVISRLYAKAKVKLDLIDMNIDKHKAYIKGVGYVRKYKKYQK